MNFRQQRRPNTSPPQNSIVVCPVENLSPNSRGRNLTSAPDPCSGGDPGGCTAGCQPPGGTSPCLQTGQCNPTGCQPISSCVGGVPKYRSPEQRACNDAGGVFITMEAADMPSNTICSATAPNNQAVGASVDCLVTISTVPTGPGTQIGIIVSPWPLSRMLPATYNSVYGVLFNDSTCTVSPYFSNPVGG